MFIYCLMPMDFWAGWMSVKAYRASVYETYQEMDDERAWSEFRKFRDKALEVAKQRLGWEGDFREGPFVAGLPTNGDGGWQHFMIGWKQDNNGSTFIASPHRLVWLEDGGNWVQA